MGDDVARRTLVSFHLPTDPDDQCFSAGQNILEVERALRTQRILAENKRHLALASRPQPLDSFIKKQNL
jgi:hypothetical protein